MFSVYPSAAEHFRRRFRIWKSVSVLFRSQRSEAGCQQDDFPVHKADDGLLPEGWQYVLSECLCVLRPGHTSTSLPFQSRPQHFRQFFATHGGSPQNTLTHEPCRPPLSAKADISPTPWGNLPQRRKRIFLVADFDGASAGKILFESEGDSPQCGEMSRSDRGDRRRQRLASAARLRERKSCVFL